MEQVRNYSYQPYLLFSSAFCWTPSFDAVKEADLAQRGFPKVLIFLLLEQANPVPKIQPSDHAKMKHAAPRVVSPRRTVSAKLSWETGRGMGTRLQQNLAINTCYRGLLWLCLLQWFYTYTDQ